ncbi:hypothetical protein [Bradyrhizobium diazoefficiens]|uniref:hypothetical protein n=1 Tax=Bradyrhizobium diazoefficiens TaxID=1355477 RepID=UPI001B54CF72|nr:hypothetical protein [Bradyrhizobium japonicum]
MPSARYFRTKNRTLGTLLRHQFKRLSCASIGANSNADGAIFGMGTKRNSHGTTVAPGKFHSVRVRFSIEMECLAAVQPPLALPQAPSSGRSYTIHRSSKLDVRRQERLPRDAREANI